MGDVVKFPAPEASSDLLWRESVGETLREERLDRGERIADVASRAGLRRSTSQRSSGVEKTLRPRSSVPWRAHWT